MGRLKDVNSALMVYPVMLTVMYFGIPFPSKWRSTATLAVVRLGTTGYVPAVSEPYSTIFLRDVEKAVGLLVS